MKKKYMDVLSGGILVLLGIALFIASFGVRQVPGMGYALGAAFFPRLGAGLLFMLGCAIAVTGYRSHMEAAPDGKISVFPLSAGTKCMLQTVALLVAYVALLEPLGFLLSSILYVFCQMVALSEKEKMRYPLFGLIAVVVSVAVYFLFTKVFYLMLPAGILTGIL